MNIWIRQVIAVLAGAASASAIWSLSLIFDFYHRPFPYGFAWAIALPSAFVLVYQLSVGISTITIIATARWAWAGVLGCLELIPLGSLFDSVGWPLFNSWALGHGMFLLALPLLIIGTSIALGVLFRPRRVKLG